MNNQLFFLILSIFIALVFEFTNGYNDAANVVSTVIATKVLKPLAAIILAAILNMIGATQTSKVAQTIIEGFLPIHSTNQLMVLSALLGAICWNLLTWFFAIPNSSSYSLIGGIVGSGIISIGYQKVFWNSVIFKVVIPMILSPVIGFTIALLSMKILYKMITKNLSSQSFAIFGKLQILSASLVALAHGFNDAQKTMAIITLILYTHGVITTLSIPYWVIGICAIVMALGTIQGGMRIVQTTGFKITKLQPVQGFTAETTASILICLASFLGFPLSSTHLIVGSISGVGAAKKLSNINWYTIKKLISAWTLTLPGAAVFSMIIYTILNTF